jgi:hypothetical protein
LAAQSGWMAKRHPNKHIREAVERAMDLGWRLVESTGHAWGTLCCPHGQRGGCRISVWSTPRNPENHARRIRRLVAGCPHQ